MIESPLPEVRDLNALAAAMHEADAAVTTLAADADPEIAGRARTRRDRAVAAFDEALARLSAVQEGGR